MRYEFAEDRFDLHRWEVAEGPCKNRYWNVFGENNDITVRFDRGNDSAAYSLSRQVLLSSRRGWRREIARAVREVRASLRNKCTTRDVYTIELNTEKINE